MRIEHLEQRVSQLADPAFAQPIRDERYDELSRRLQAMENNASSVDVTRKRTATSAAHATERPERTHHTGGRLHHATAWDA